MEEHMFIKRIDNEIDSIVVDRNNLTNEEVRHLGDYSTIFNIISKASAFTVGLCVLLDYLLAKNAIKNMYSDTIWQELLRVAGFALSTSVGMLGVIARYVFKELKVYVDDVIKKGDHNKKRGK